MDITKSDRLHFIGIGGCGMSSIARVLLEMGYHVSGSDMKENSSTLRLKDMGATVSFRHDPSHVRLGDIVIVSAAIPETNVELIRARELGLPLLKRAEMLNFLMMQFSHRVAVAGTHGKTTTTALIARMLDRAKARPTYVIGGELSDYGGNASYGGSERCVVEADESDGSFLLLEPTVAIVTNIEPEHMEHYGDMDRLCGAFEVFISGVISRGGYAVVNRDDADLCQIISNVSDISVAYYSIHQPSDVRASDIVFTPTGLTYQLHYKGQDCGEIRLRVFGKHNVYNSLAVLAYGLREGMLLDDMKKGLIDFSGTNRRFQLVGHANDISIYDDYGHHPTEIMTTLAGIKQSLARRIICIFQPHRYSRTRDLLEGFPGAFDSADIVVITEIYSANEEYIEGISARLIVERMTIEQRNKALFVPAKSDIAAALLPKLRPDDIVLTMGAGDIYTVGKELYAQLRRKEAMDNGHDFNEDKL